MKTRSLTGTATMIVLLYGVFAMGGVFILLDRQEHKTIRRQVAQRLFFDLNVRVADLEHEAEALRRTARVLADTPPIQGMLRAARNGGVDPMDGSFYETWRIRLEHIFKAALGSHAALFQARYIRADDGQELVRVERRGEEISATPEPLLQSKLHRDYMREILSIGAGQTYTSQIDLNREVGSVQEAHTRTIRAGIPIFDAEGRAFGVVIVNADFGEVLERLQEDLGAGASAYLLGSDGEFLSHPHPDKAFGFDLGTSHTWQDVSPQTLPGERFLGRPGDLKAVPTADGDLLIAARDILLDPDFPSRMMTLVLAVPQSEVDQRVARTRNSVLAGVIAVAVPMIFLMLAQLHRSLAPVRRLAISVQKVGEGNLEGSLPDSVPGEVGDLVIAFRKMVESLAQRREEVLELNAELRRSEEVASLIVETAPNAIVVVDGDGQIERVNRQLEAIFGYQRNELVGRPLEQLLPESVRERHRQLRSKYVADPVAREMGKGRDLFGIHRDGTEIPVEIGLAPMVLDGKIRVIGTITDIRVRKAALEEVRRLNTELEVRVRERTAALEAINKELGAFAYSVSHDLRAPLRAIDGFSRILEEDYTQSLDQEGIRLLGVVRSNSQQMAQLIDDLLSFSRVGRRDLKKAKVDMAELARSCIERLRSGHERGAAVEYEIGDLPEATGDPALLRQVWTNLLENAIKYSPGAPKIQVLGASRDGQVRFEVADQGVGFDMRFVDKLFGVFQRLHSAEDFEGTGVGLALVHRIVSRHGGDVWASGRVGEGATFGFWLPVLVDDPGEHDGINEDNGPEGADG